MSESQKFKTVWHLLFFVFTHRPQWRLLILLSSLFSAVFGLATPFFQKEFIDVLLGQTPIWDLSLSAGPLLFISLVCLITYLAFGAYTNYLGAQEAIAMQREMAQKLYDQALHMRSDSFQGRPVGEMVSVYATDIPHSTVLLDQSLPVGASILFPLVLAPIVLVTVFHIPASLIALLFAILILLNLGLAFRQSVYFFKFKTLAADRVALVSEWIQNIRALKILGWVPAFEERIFAVRKIETKNRIAMVTNGQFMNSVSSSVTFVLNLGALVLSLYIIPENLRASEILALLWIIGVFLTKPFRQLPWFFTFVFDSWTSLKRLHQYLSLQNIDYVVRPQEFQKIHPPAATISKALSVQNLSLNIQGQPLLKNISFEIVEGQLVCIVGEVGCGKTLLLLSLLGETSFTAKSLQIYGNESLQMPLPQIRQFFSYVSQEGFIMSATLRENVFFDYQKETSSDDRVRQSLRQAQFLMNLERMENDLDTEIGERGVNLSGGQKQRVSIARAHYFSGPILLLDDCLSALDVETEEKIVEQLFFGDWKEKTKLLVTHRLSVLEKSDWILFMKDGQLQSQGKLHDLLAHSEEFRQFTSTMKVIE